MDKNSITGAILIVLIMLGGTYYFSTQNPDPKDTKAKQEVTSTSPNQISKTTLIDSVGNKVQKTADTLPAYWAPYGKGEEKFITLENEKIIVKVSTKGGRIAYTEIKGYKNTNGKPVVLTQPGSSNFDYHFLYGDAEISTGDLFFTPSETPAVVKGNNKASLSMTLSLPDGKSMVQTYTLKGNDYMVDYSLALNNMNDVLPRRINYIDLYWKANLLNHEKDLKITRSHATIHYKNQDETPDELSESKNDEEKFKTKTQWVSFKEQFFCQTLIAKGFFDKGELSTVETEDSSIVKTLSARLSLQYNHNPIEKYNMQFYFGPLHYKTLSSYNLDLERQIPLGWGFFLIQWVNRFVIINIFNFLSSFITNYGLIIFLMTVIIKLALMPLTYKSYLSTAKMRILKPELDEMKSKVGSDVAKQQQEQMKIYKKAGVSPFGGCLPLLLQFPFLVAMFRFFPSSIELRQQPFLWATDLSTYDSIYNFGFAVPWYGDHVSLFTLLMTISTIAYAYFNSSLTPQQSEFKWMSYLMPIMFLGLFNNYSAGLSLYYFLFNILTFAQQYIFKIMIDDKKLIAQIEEHKKKPTSGKKSKFSQRLEDMMKQQQQLQQQRGKKK
ncbi:MAG: membrane protein insertase YidC [Bacteroidetes bacterium]|nr:membrane protein insertase YidC [Bacteroidota bacterium]